MRKKLFTPHKIKNVELKNRIIMTGMHLGYDFDKEIEFLKARARGGAAAVTVIAGVNDVGAVFNMSVADEAHGEDFKRLADVIHENDSKIFVQLFHAGRNGKLGLMKDSTKQPIAPSVVPSPMYRENPKEMTIEDINSTIDDFGKSALYLKNAGVDAVEISCSAGYLLSTFLSPLTNLRTDVYGGSEENRMRFPKEVIEKVRESVGPDYAVILRISGSDMLGGYGIGDMQNFVASLADGLIDAINVTGGWHEARVPQISANVPEGGFAMLAGAIKRVVDIPVIACNRINNGEIAEEILHKGLGDFVGCARPFLGDAEFANKIEKNIPFRKCIACNKGCIERVFKMKSGGCIWNPRIGKEGEQIVKAKYEKKVLVVGAGPSGMEAAINASLRGHDVTLCSNKSEVGGLLHIAGKPPQKSAILDNIKALKYEVEQLDIKMKYNVKVTDDFIKEINPDHVIVAVGSSPFTPSIEGVDGKNVYYADDVLRGDTDLITKLRKGQTYIVGGGAVGLETAHFLAEEVFANFTSSFNFLGTYVPAEMRQHLFKPLDITVVEMLSKAGKDLGATRLYLLNELKNLGVKVMTNTKILSMSGDEITLATKDGEVTQPVTNIILAIGYKANGSELVKYLEENKYAFTVIGDACKPRNIEEALVEAYEAAASL